MFARHHKTFARRPFVPATLTEAPDAFIFTEAANATLDLALAQEGVDLVSPGPQAKTGLISCERCYRSNPRTQRICDHCKRPAHIRTEAHHGQSN